MSFPFDPEQGLVIVRAELWGPAGSAVLRLAIDRRDWHVSERRVASCYCKASLLHSSNSALIVPQP
jgi:hypothetical protein